eukprot:COSAG06_NODE_4950_length_3837_cov_4.204655_6_plen_35_part_00
MAQKGRFPYHNRSDLLQQLAFRVVKACKKTDPSL